MNQSIKPVKQPARFIKAQPKTQDDIRHDRDCVVRAICLAANHFSPDPVPYRDVYETAYQFGWRTGGIRYDGKTHRRFKSGRHRREWIHQFYINCLDRYGIQAVRETFKAEPGQQRMRTYLLPADTAWLACQARHVAFVHDQTVYDTWDSSDKCVYTGYRLAAK